LSLRITAVKYNMKTGSKSLRWDNTRYKHATTMTHLDTGYVGLYMSALKDTKWSLNNYFVDSQMFGRIIIFFIRLIQSVEDSPNFPESVIIVK
jgi:hypothetical protein